MASAPMHKLGQLIGEFLEKHFEDVIRDLCVKRNLYLDVVGEKRPARNSKKVTWEDIYGCMHDLDFVIERNGTSTRVGEPVAFIECAWRRYTKHSKNKAQEIQGAILPIVRKHSKSTSFLGAILAGEFTQPSIEQLNASGFSTLYFDYISITKAFARHGVDVLYGEHTPDAEAFMKIQAFNSLSEDKLLQIFSTIKELNQAKVEEFIKSLETALDRGISSIVISPLFGQSYSFNAVGCALEFLLESQNLTAKKDDTLQNIFIQVCYSNGSKVEGQFKTQLEAERFLRSCGT